MKTALLIFIILCLSLFAILPLIYNGFFNVHDNTQVVRVYEMGKMLLGGYFPVRWVPDLGYGYGYPIFNFYSPFPYYVGGLFNIVGFDVLSATKLMFGLGILLSGITMFFLSRRFFGDIGGIVSAIIYMYFPYHAVNIYVRGAVGEFFAYAFLPLVFLGILSSLKDNKKIHAISQILAISFGIFMIAISHNLSLFMLLVLLIPTFVICSICAKNKGYFLSIFTLSLLVGLGLSAFYIVPAFLEMPYTNVASQVGGGADFRDHFVCLPQFWDSMWGFGGSVKGCIDGMSFKLGKSNIIFLALGLILFVYTGLYKNSNYKQVIYVSLILLSIALLLTLPILSIVWRFVPLMDYIQYPWRFINFISLFFSFLIAGIPFVIAQKLDRKFGYFAGIFIVIITILMNGKLFVPQSNNNFSSTYYTNEDYVKYTVSKISDEYLPHRFEKPQNPEQIPTKAVELDPSIGEEYIIENKPLKLLIRYETKKEGKLHINRAFYPSWKAYINNQNVLLSKHQRGMEVLLPKGNGVLQIRMESTGSQILGNSITLITLFALIVGIMLFSRKMYGK